MFQPKFLFNDFLNKKNVCLLRRETIDVFFLNGTFDLGILFIYLGVNSIAKNLLAQYLMTNDFYFTDFMR